MEAVRFVVIHSLLLAIGLFCQIFVVCMRCGHKQRLDSAISSMPGAVSSCVCNLQGIWVSSSRPGISSWRKVAVWFLPSCSRASGRNMQLFTLVSLPRPLELG
jgi:hypothetical protein